MKNDEIKEIIKRCETFQKSGYSNRDLAAKLIVDFENIKNANIIPNDFNHIIWHMTNGGLTDEITHKHTDVILAALKDYIRK
jgi:hypothetical protein